MKFPNTIDPNTIKCYQISNRSSLNKFCQNFGEWCENLPKTLKEICIQVIADNWKDYPKLNELILPEDRCLLLNLISSHLPLEFSVPRIPDNIFWKKCSMERWPSSVPHNLIEKHMFFFANLNEADENVEAENSHFITWKSYYLERHVMEYLEQLKPEEYDPEQIRRMCDLCGDYIRSFKLDEMKCYNGENLNQLGRRIPLNAILAGLPKIEELSICFQQKFVGFHNFTWKNIGLQDEDIKLFAKGLEKIRPKKLRITNSSLDGKKCVPILKAILKYDSLNLLDLSHCNLGDNVASMVFKLALELKIKYLQLVNNNISEHGAETLAHVLMDPECSLQSLNLRLNPVKTKGSDLIFSALCHNKSLKIINMEACSIRMNQIISDTLRNCTNLEELYLANNLIGYEIGRLILDDLKFNFTLRKIDVRMCQVDSELQQKIHDQIQFNRKSNMTNRIIPCEIERKPNETEFDENFKIYFENLLNFDEPDNKEITDNECEND